MGDSTTKLATIVFTDIVGFTKLSSENEPLAIQLLDTQRSTLRPIVDRHNGEWIKEIGDGLLLCFNTTKDAVECAIEIQHTVKNVANLDIRIGVHQGEVVSRDGDVFGDDVNVASRIEPFASPGGIVVSGRVNSSLIRNPVYQTKLLGKPELKGIGQELKLYCITSHGLPGAEPLRESPQVQPVVQEKSEEKKKSKLPLILGGIAGLVLLSGIIFFISGTGDKASSDKNELSIAVLPFVNMSSDKENEYFSDGMTEEILNSLAQISKLKVAARTSSFAFKGKNVDIRSIGKELSVAHILEGSVRKFGDDIRVTAQLIRISDGYHLWSNTFDRKFEEIFKMQKEISDAIADQMKIKLIGEKIIERKGITQNPEALDLYMQGRFLWNQNQEKAVLRSIEYFEKALDKDPQYALAESAIADAYYSLGLIKRWTVSHDERSRIFQNSEDHARKALSLEPELGEAYAVLGALYQGDKVSRHWKMDLDLAEKYFEKAIELSPSYTPAYVWYSNMLTLFANTLTDENKQLAEELFLKAYKIDPLSAHVNIRGGMLYSHEYYEYELALSYFDKAFELDPYLVYGSINFEYTSLLQKLYHWDRAEKSWNYAYQTDSTHFGTLWGITYHYINRSMFDKANHYMKKLYLHYPNGIDGKMSDMRALNSWIIITEEEDYEKTIDLLSKVMDENPCWYQVLIDAAICFKKSNQKDRGLTVLDNWATDCYENGNKSERFMNRYNNYLSTAKFTLTKNEKDKSSVDNIEKSLSLFENTDNVYRRIIEQLMSGEHEKTLDDLEFLYENYATPSMLKNHPLFDELRDRPRFNDLLDKMNLN